MLVEWLVYWILSAIALLIVSWIVPGFRIAGLGTALFSVLVIGLLNVTAGVALKVITFPLSFLTFGLFLLVINALILLIASKVVPGFSIRGFFAAFWGALVLALVGVVFRGLGPTIW